MIKEIFVCRFKEVEPIKEVEPNNLSETMESFVHFFMHAVITANFAGGRKSVIEVHEERFWVSKPSSSFSSRNVKNHLCVGEKKCPFVPWRVSPKPATCRTEICL